MRRSVLAILAAVCLGCMGTSALITTALAPAQGIGASVLCDSGCVRHWQRAQLWLANHSAMKIQTATDVLLQTYNTTGYEPSYSFSVTKSPMEMARSYRIEITLACGNPLGCSPDALSVRNAFLYYVKTGEDLLVGKVGGGNGIR